MPAPKVLPPRLPEPLTPAEVSPELLAQMMDGDDLRGLRFEGAVFLLPGIEKASFAGCSFSRCTFPPGQALRFDFLDCAFSGCDFAGASFSGGAFLRVSFDQCRATGTVFTEASLRHAAFTGCQMAYANFGLARLTDALLTGCELPHASFGESRLQKTAFTDCRLSGAEFFRTSLRGMDMRTNRIDGIVLGDRSEIAGATFTSLQACQLALLLDIRIQD